MSKNPYAIGSLEHQNYERYGAPRSPFADMIGMRATARERPQSTQSLSDQEVWDEMKATEKRLTTLRAELSKRCQALHGTTKGIFAESTFVPRSTAEAWQDEAEQKYHAAKRKLDALEAPARRAAEEAEYVQRTARAEAEKVKMVANQIVQAGAKARAPAQKCTLADLPTDRTARVMILHNWSRHGSPELREAAENELARMRADGNVIYRPCFVRGYELPRDEEYSFRVAQFAAKRPLSAEHQYGPEYFEEVIEPVLQGLFDHPIGHC